jgi:Wnt-binding factor required for Wnt secretion
VLTLKNMTKYHRYILVEAFPVVKDSKKLKKIAAQTVLQFNRSVESTSGEPVVLHHATVNQTLECSEEGTDCDSFTLFYIPQINLNAADISITFKLLNHAAALRDGAIQGVDFSVKTGNPPFVNIITTSKYLLFFVSFVSLLTFIVQLRKLSAGIRVIEQTLVLRQGILLVLLNDPFYAMIFYSPNHFHIVYYSVVTVAYYSHLMYYWLVVFERVYVENSQKSNKTDQLWKKSLVAVAARDPGALPVRRAGVRHEHHDVLLRPGLPDRRVVPACSPRVPVGHALLGRHLHIARAHLRGPRVHLLAHADLTPQEPRARLGRLLHVHDDLPLQR